MNEFFDITRFNLQDIQLYQRELDFVFLLKQIQEEILSAAKKKKNKTHLLPLDQRA